MTKNNPENKRGIRIPSQVWLWFLSITLALTACGGRGGDNVVVPDVTPAPPPTLTTLIPEETKAPEKKPVVSVLGTKPASSIEITPIIPFIPDEETFDY